MRREVIGATGPRKERPVAIDHFQITWFPATRAESGIGRKHSSGRITRRCLQRFSGICYAVHHSQLDEHTGWEERVRQRMAEMGQEHGFTAAEVFKKITL